MPAFCLCGPESTGKTAVAEALAGHFDLPQVAEYARCWLTGRGAGYQYREADLLTIAEGQWRTERAILDRHDHAILDTDLLNIRLWSDIKYGRCHPWILKQSAETRGKIYLLMAPDIPFVADDLREGNDRAVLYQRWQKLLTQTGVCYLTVSGQAEARFRLAASLVEDQLARAARGA